MLKFKNVFFIVTFSSLLLCLPISCSKDSTVPETVTDIDGNAYKTIKIGDQWWLAENLRVTHYRNGDAIPNIKDNTAWSTLSTGAYCAYNNDNGNIETYGVLYNWYAVDDSRKIAPAGWHVPTDADWKELEMYLGMNQSDADLGDWRGMDEGGKLKEDGTEHWESPNTGASNESGFKALPGGFRGVNGTFSDIRYEAEYWSADLSSGKFAWYRALDSKYSEVGRFQSYGQSGFCVRLVRD